MPYPSSTKSGLVIIITGSTGSGKDSVIQKIITKAPKITKLITTTTRSPRQREIDGQDYYFKNRNTFAKMQQSGEFLETKEYGNNWYGTTLAEFKKTLQGQDIIWKNDPTMAARAKGYFQQAFDLPMAQNLISKTVVIYLRVADKQTLEKRLEGRGMDIASIDVRLKQDMEDWNNLKDKFDYIIDNSDGKLDLAVDEILKIIDTKKLSS